MTPAVAAFAVGGVSGSKNGRAPALDVGGSGARNGALLGSTGASACEASARAELEAAVTSGAVADASASALRFRSMVGATVGSAL